MKRNARILVFSGSKQGALLYRASVLAWHVMKNVPLLPPIPKSLICFAIFLLCTSGQHARAAALTWQNGGVGNWFVHANWGDDNFPTANDSASFEVGGTALVQRSGATAATLSLRPATGNPAEVLVSGQGASLSVVGPASSETTPPILLESASPIDDTDQPATATLQIQNGGAVSAQMIDIESGGILNIGAGGTGGTVDAASILNNGTITFNLTDTTTVDANIIAAGTIIKEGVGTAVLNASVAASSIQITGGTLTLANIGTLATPVTVTGPSSIFKILGGTSNAFPITILNGGTLDNAGTIGTGTALNLGPGTANVINRGTGSITGTSDLGDGLSFSGGGTVQNFGFISGITDREASGIVVSVGPGIIFNSGTITGAVGITLNAGGSVTNVAGGAIAVAIGQAIFAQGAPVTVVNSGTISGTVGVVLSNGGSVTNNAGGTIKGADTGITADQVATVANSGTISGDIGVALFSGGAVTNNAGGLIVSGRGSPAVISNGGSLIFLNAGTIQGSITLVNFANQATLVTGGTIAGDLNLGTNTGATLTLDGTGSERLSQAVTGVITNDGSLIKQGSGTWIIDKPLGNYAGGTTVNAGTLDDALTSALGTGGITVTGSTSLLHVNQGVTITNAILLTQGGSIDNSGTISVTPGGPVSITGDGNLTNEATGVIANAAGDAVNFKAAGTVTNLAGGLIRSGTAWGVLSTNGQTSITNYGTISGVEGISITGSGSVVNNAGGVISGSSGLAILSSGEAVKVSNAGTIKGNVSLGNAANTVQLFSGGRINGNLNLGASATSNLILDGSGDQPFSQAVTGTITNAGSLTKQGSGNWILDVAMNAPASTNILAGVLTVNSTLKSPVVTIQAGGLLKGSGVVIGNVVSVGTISPGNSPGTLTVNGNFTQGPAGVYNVQIVSPQNYSRLVISGHANLDGTLHLTLASGFQPTPGERFTVLTAGHGISGTFRTISSNTPVSVSYGNGVVDVDAVSAPKQQVQIHLSDGTPVSTTALLADYTFYGFGSLSERTALGSGPTEEAGKNNAISLTFDSGEFDIQGQHGRTNTIPIAGGVKINDRVRLDYEIPLQYITVDDTSLFQAGLTIDVPVKVLIPSARQPWSWIVTPTAACASSGSKEIIGGGALTNVFSYQWHGITATYGNYICFFEGHVLVTNDPSFPNGVSQQIMKNGLRLDVPFAKSWIIEAYGIYTQFFQPATVSSYFTIGAEVGPFHLEC